MGPGCTTRWSILPPSGAPKTGAGVSRRSQETRPERRCGGKGLCGSGRHIPALAGEGEALSGGGELGQCAPLCPEGAAGRWGSVEAQKIEREAREARAKIIAETEEAGEAERAKREEKKRYEERTRKGKDLFNQRDFPAAIQVFEEARLLGAGQGEVETLLGCCHAEMGNMAQAEQIFQELSVRFPSNPVCHVNLGRAYVRNHFPLEAAREFEKAFRRIGDITMSSMKPA